MHFSKKKKEKPHVSIIVGKIFALTTSLESLSPLIAAPLYTTVYNATLDYYPGIFNFISAGLYLLCFTFISWVLNATTCLFL